MFDPTYEQGYFKGTYKCALEVTCHLHWPQATLPSGSYKAVCFFGADVTYLALGTQMSVAFHIYDSSLNSLNIQ